MSAALTSQAALPSPLAARSAPPPSLALPEEARSLPLHQAALLTEIRRQIARLQAREAEILAEIPGHRPGWPLQRLHEAKD